MFFGFSYGNGYTFDTCAGQQVIAADAHCPFASLARGFATVNSGVRPQQESLKMDSELNHLIEEEIVRFIQEGSTEAPEWSKEYAAKLNALPVIFDMSGIFALRPNGEVISVAYDDFESLGAESLRLEQDERIRNIAYFKTSRMFPKLAMLEPQRTLSSKECHFCKGTGQLERPYSSIVCFCGGLGWIPG